MRQVSMRGMDMEGKRLEGTGKQKGTKLWNITYLVKSHHIREILLVEMVIPIPRLPNRWWFPLEIFGDLGPYFWW